MLLVPRRHAALFSSSPPVTTVLECVDAALGE